MALTGSCTTPCLFALVLDPAAACQSVRLRLPCSARVSVSARANGIELSEFDTTAVGSPPTLPRFDCSPRARLASGCSDLLCRTGFGSRRPRRVVKNGFYPVFTSFPPFTGFSCRETPSTYTEQLMAVGEAQGSVAEAVTENTPFTCLVKRWCRRNNQGLDGGKPSASARCVHTTRHDAPRHTRAEGQRGADRVAAKPSDGSRVRPVRMQGLSRRGWTLVRPEAKTQQTGRYHVVGWGQGRREGGADSPSFLRSSRRTAAPCRQPTTGITRSNSTLAILRTERAPILFS